MTDVRRKLISAGKTGPLGACALRKAVPVTADDIPVHHRPLQAVGVRGRHRVVGVIEVGTTNGEYDAEKDSDEDAHGETPRSPISNAADQEQFRARLGGLDVNCDSKTG